MLIFLLEKTLNIFVHLISTGKVSQIAFEPCSDKYLFISIRKSASLFKI